MDQRLIEVAERVAALVAQRQKIESELDALLGGRSWARPNGGSRPNSKPPRLTAGAARGRKRGLQKGSLAFRIVALVRKIGKPVKAATVAAGIRERRVEVVSTTMHRLRRTGYLRRVGRGKYGEV